MIHAIYPHGKTAIISLRLIQTFSCLTLFTSQSPSLPPWLDPFRLNSFQITFSSMVNRFPLFLGISCDLHFNFILFDNDQTGGQVSPEQTINPQSLHLSTPVSPGDGDDHGFHPPNRISQVHFWDLPTIAIQEPHFWVQFSYNHRAH